MAVLETRPESAPEENEIRPTNALRDASFLSRLFFQWAYPLMKIGLSRPIEEKDLPEVLPVDSSAYNLELMEEKLWRREVERCYVGGEASDTEVKAGARKTRRIRKPSLHRSILIYYMRAMAFTQIKLAFSMAARVAQALALGSLIETFTGDSSNGQSGYLWAGILVLCAAVVLFLTHSLFFDTWRMGMQLRIASVAAIYSKSLRLSSIGGVDAAESGQVMNLASNDVERFILASVACPYLVWGPVEAVGILVLGLHIIGRAFAAGYALLLIFIPMQFYLSKRFAVLRSRIAAITDSRVTLVSQAVSGARVMKMSGWEWQFGDRIAKIRSEEVQNIQRANRLKAWNETIFFTSNVAVAIVIFTVHVLVGGVLTTRTVFTTLTLVNIVQFTMAKFFSLAVMTVSECFVSITRIQKFFEFQELSTGAAEDSASRPRESERANVNAIALSKVDCYWGTVKPESGDRANVLHGDILRASVALASVTLDLNMKELCCIIGPVGCGKSALLLALAGELLPSSGSMERNYESLAYSAQDPWIMDGSVKENITMGLTFDGAWYSKVVAACGLTEDFLQFRNGDATIVGDRGVQCSGGQRARIGLARALYRDADVMLLDDPLSAVDSKVGRLIYDSAIQDLGVKRGKCVVLVTHQHQFIGNEKCVLMDKGKVLCVGTYSSCVNASNGSLKEVIQADKASSDSLEDVASEKAGDDILDTANPVFTNDNEVKPSTAPDFIDDEDDDAQKEASNTGVVKLSTWIEYAAAMGGVWVGVGLLALFAAAQGAILVTIVSLGKWAEQPAADQSSPVTIGLVFGLGALMVVFAVARAGLSFFLSILASQRLHDRMTQSVLRAKIEFFDCNPLGRILNRFSADVGINDDLLPPTLYDFLVCAFLALGGVATAVSVLPFTLLAVPPLIIFFVRVRRIFVTTSRELKRLEGITRSPIYAMMSESLSGIATIRANGAIEYFRSKFEEAHDAHGRAFFAFIATSRWLGFRMDSIMFLLLALSSFLAVLFQDQGWFGVDPAVLGLALTMLLQLAGTFQWGVRQSAEVINQMVSVERVSAFGHLPLEADLTTKHDDEVGDQWPHHGCIEANNLTVRYRSGLPPSLTNVSFKIDGGKRVGVVGRTGSGKSTLVQALFRILEAEEGSITIDGVDISDLGLHKLRTEMSVIPQTPVLFNGCTVRENLDPWGKYNDQAIKTALEDVQMAKAVEELPLGLDFVVSENGSNFSVGQRQLLSLARAILRKNKILILDEPTANVDSRTDALLQQAIAKSFEGATIISVAHRLETIIDYDSVMVLGTGKVLEYGSPKDLLRKEGGYFASMVEDTGEEMAEELRSRANM